MCSKPKAPKPIKEKEPQYMRNPWLDGLAIGGLGGIRTGRNSLRVDLGGTNASTGLAIPQPTQPATPVSGAYPAPVTAPSPIAPLTISGGGGGGGRGNRTQIR